MYRYRYTYVECVFSMCVYVYIDIDVLCMGFPGGSDSKESSCNVGDLGLIPGLGRSLGGG